jgi:hypothetical protein
MISRYELGQRPASRNVVARLSFAVQPFDRELDHWDFTGRLAPPRPDPSPPNISTRLWPRLSSDGNTSGKSVIRSASTAR